MDIERGVILRVVAGPQCFVDLVLLYCEFDGGFDEIDHGRELNLTVQPVKAQLSDNGAGALELKKEVLLDDALATGQAAQTIVTVINAA